MSIQPQPNHVRVLGDQDLLDLLNSWENEDETPEPDDAWDETTNMARTYELTIGFEAETLLEAELVASAIHGFVTRRTTATDLVAIFTNNKENQA